MKDVTEKKIQTAVTGTEPKNESVEWSVFPNPADNQIITKFSLKENTKIQITIFDKIGKKVKELSVENLMVGEYSRQISLNELSADTFLVRLSIGEKHFGKILVVK